MQKAITLTELASRAGVSPATVSIVLNNRPLSRNVAEKTRERIQALAKECNYRANHLAQAMLRQSTRTIGFICGDIATPYYAELTNALSLEAEKREYRLITQTTRWNFEKELEALEMLLTRAVDGVLMCSSICATHGEQVERLCHGRPLVMLGGRDHHPGIVSVYCDVEPGMAEVFSFLHENGTQEITLVDDPRFRHKYEAYAACCSRYGYQPRVLEFRHDDDDSVRRCADRIAELRPEVVIIASDYVAAQIISRLGGAGIQIPQDLSVVSINGTAWSEIYNPPLTSLELPVKELAQTSVDELFRQIGGTRSPTNITVTTRMKIGRSVKINRNQPEDI